MQLLFFLFYFLLLAAALATGAFFLIVFAAVIAGVSLFLFIYMKLTGHLPGNMRFYRFEQRTRQEEHGARGTKVIEGEFEEIDRPK